ncbi:hypothetical protein VHEMI09616 [[Torrubiella] hemipterigena]|uniref:Uncharacterized protein n=1 Tax=[Torrubiella] hemipterigena TaxID=1531966 RepID=A0A0A1TAD4_9HYPO|nr:hypothetical protein VHEMI09616 [[Torrubiella] hemipterigena]
MDTGGLAQMSSNFSHSNGLPTPSGGLSSRRGGQNIKPLSFDAINRGNAARDTGAPTPRTSRSHLLAGLRTAPKSATAASFGPTSPTVQQHYARNSMAASLHGHAQDSLYNPPKTALPHYGNQQNSFASMMNQPQQQQQHQHQQQQQQYTVDQVLAPPELAMDDQYRDQMDPNLYAQLVATNMYLAQQQQQLQQQLRSVQAAAQQFQQMNINSPQLSHQQQQAALYEQQQRQLQQRSIQAAISQGQQVYYSPVTGQYYVDNAASASPAGYAEQPMPPSFDAYQQGGAGPRLQVSPPPEHLAQNGLRSISPPKRFDSPQDAAPLPPPSANAFRRGHKKASSLAPVNSILASAMSCDGPKSAGPKTATFPLTPMTGGYGPGQARAGEHPIRQPRGPPSLDELKSKPTAKHEGSKNFATRTRRSAVHNLVRAGLVRRKGTGSSAGSMSPVSETAEDSASPITDNESDSGRSGSGSLIGDLECGSSRTSASGSWGAIGSDRPSSAQKTASGGDASPVLEADNSSFANVFKNSALRAAKEQEALDNRKAARLVLTSADKRKANAA